MLERIRFVVNLVLGREMVTGTLEQQALRLEVSNENRAISARKARLREIGAELPRNEQFPIVTGQQVKTRPKLLGVLYRLIRR